ncbi:mechanosensitive ion channel family protein [Metabacillus halosaccharovorans]|uniref:mechanosensitive ion channel family protein n=1 Tax=Metabacillus halosaccharovorans TaxID=930124 RepID=UPI00203E6EA3|nr:mechanosensitive ion channel domain-containing protein [Metabacillus halosaccharovorans]MCM3442660.1 mechanosensitive ion channel family protein [Metabacillus halosaccharovorans]
METIKELLGLKVVQIILVAVILVISVTLINFIVGKFFKKTNFIEERKEKTIESLIRSLTKYTATISFILYLLSQFVDNFGSILAGAGLAGIIIGFGAQSLIKDILAGMFIIYEKQLHQGDFITINNTFHGTVEEIGLRSLKIREWSGKLLTISNGEIKQIHNYNIDRMRVIERVVISYREDPDMVWQVLEEACEKINMEFESCLKRDSLNEIIEHFQVFGITSLNGQFRGYEYTIIGLVDDQFYWSTAKGARRIIAKALFDANINLAESRVLINQIEKELSN